MLKIFKRHVHQTVVGVLLLLTSACVFAQSNPIKLMVGFPAGGGTDAIARILGEHLSQKLGTPVSLGRDIPNPSYCLQSKHQNRTLDACQCGQLNSAIVKSIFGELWQ